MAHHEYDTPEEVITYATGGRLTKHALASLLTARAKQPFLDACATIELKYTKDCASTDTCLEAGCSAEGERCLQPLLRAGTEYDKACGAEWAKLFADAGNRDPSWRVTVSAFELS
jgi:hypothetical protein